LLRCSLFSEKRVKVLIYIFIKTSLPIFHWAQTALTKYRDGIHWMHWLKESIRESDIDEFLMGMASQVAEREDHIVTPDLHGHVFGTLDFSRRDLMAVNIQRGRDHGLPDYNTARKYFDLPPITRWKDINANSEKLASLTQVK